MGQVSFSRITISQSQQDVKNCKEKFFPNYIFFLWNRRSLKVLNDSKLILKSKIVSVTCIIINTSYLTDSYIIFTLKMESVSRITNFGLKTMVKSGLNNHLPEWRKIKNIFLPYVLDLIHLLEQQFCSDSIFRVKTMYESVK